MADCALCARSDARLYPAGRRCDRCAPWAAAGRPAPGQAAYGDQLRRALSFVDVAAAR